MEGELMVHQELQYSMVW